MSGVRAVWMTREQRDWLREAYADPSGSWDVPSEVADAWDAAPADPAEAIYDELRELNISRATLVAERIAHALGYPATRSGT